MLDVGCGQGELTTGLAVAGYDVLGIDPLAPQGDRFRRILLEDLGVEEGPFDVVVASHSLHHVRDLGQALDRIVSLLRPAGALVLDEHGWDLADEATLDWLYNQRRTLAAAGQGEMPASLDVLRDEWAAEHSVSTASTRSAPRSTHASTSARSFARHSSTGCSAASPPRCSSRR